MVELGSINELKLIYYDPFQKGRYMKKMPQNQFAEWKHLTDDRCLTTPQDELIDDYFACMISSNGKEEEKICQSLLC